MKTIVFDRRTRDVDGLLIALRKIGPVLSVGSDRRKTYVYVGDDVQYNPEPVVNAWQDIPEIRVESMNPVAPDGVPTAKADGNDTHTLVIQKVGPGGNVIPDDTRLRLSTSKPVPISEPKVRLKDGLDSVTVGPSDKIGDVLLDVQDPSGNMKAIRMVLRFVEPPREKPVEPETTESVVMAPDDIKDQGGVWAKLRNMLGF